MTCSMSTEKATTQYVILHETVLQSWLRDASTFVVFCGLISIGVVVDSPPMQWAGFFVAMVFMFARSGATKVKRLTREEAIAYLNTEAAE